MTGEFVSALEQQDGTWIVVVRLTHEGNTYLHATEFEVTPALVFVAPPEGTLLKPEPPAP